MIKQMVETAHEMTADPVTQEKLRWRLETSRKQLQRLLQTYAPEHPVVQECRREIEDLTRQIALEPDAVPSPSIDSAKETAPEPPRQAGELTPR